MERSLRNSTPQDLPLRPRHSEDDNPPSGHLFSENQAAWDRFKSTLAGLTIDEFGVPSYWLMPLFYYIFNIAREEDIEPLSKKLAEQMPWRLDDQYRDYFANYAHRVKPSSKRKFLKIRKIIAEDNSALPSQDWKRIETEWLDAVLKGNNPPFALHRVKFQKSLPQPSETVIFVA